MLSEWSAMERYRIQVMELWPDGPRKEVGLASARSSLEALARGMPGCHLQERGAAFTCVIYTGSRPPVTPMPAASRVPRPECELAA